jgi:hypothetical protein
VLRKNIDTGITDTIIVEDDVVFNNPISSAYLLTDFSEGEIDEKSYRIYDYMRGEVSDHKFSYLEDNKITLANKEMDVMVLNDYNSQYGLNTRCWINRADGKVVKFEVMNRVISLADESVIKQIRTVDLDNTIFAKVDESIPNFTELSYMKVKASIQTGGEEVSTESLNFSGQRFSGTVEDNFIQGTFEVEPVRFTGDKEIPFPPVFKEGAVDQKYLNPEILIESDHPMIVAKAKEITKEAKDSWEAVILLSTWVGEEIRGAVPGGTSAINTLRIKEGECGSHSRLLTALCRASGIPARVVIGCMYSPYYGGSFGQHAWTQVFLGEEIGWIAVDATILEFDYIDAGHITLGERAVFNPEKMEILEYQIGEGLAPFDEIQEGFSTIIGAYTNPANGDVLTAKNEEGTLVVDIKGKIELALKEADQNGRRYALLTNNLYFMFPQDSMVVVEKVHAVKNSSEEIEIEEGTPSNLQDLIGTYKILQLQKEFRISWGKGELYVLIPDTEEPQVLEYNDESDLWRQATGNKEYIFTRNEDGHTSGMDIYVHNLLTKNKE